MALNNATEATSVEITTLTPGASYAPLYGATAPVTADADGTVLLTIPALGAVAYKAGAPSRTPAPRRRSRWSPAPRRTG
ncbi:hypothetical protein G7085_07300 [Tessaracoccus sp. HDW20]|uniref:hypothetical protein n=1 Tax=Tessaracoccus coleopterorum TaxID=2714950 RepID=UPI0018D422EE|nr:hypothetical protein [Tessaracoccus coleopterorum]NHB84478.1 hypothetical protein [Tessaracoccus coleopterorum]